MGEDDKDDGVDGYVNSAPVDPRAFEKYRINPDVFSGMFGAGDELGNGAEYVEYETKGAVDRMFFQSGCSYLLGIGAGGAWGVVDGWRTSPSPKLRIRLNSVLNKSGHYGSRLGNALGALACMFSLFEAGTEYVRIEDRLPFAREDVFNPVVAAALTGVLYKSTQGPKTMALAGLLSGAAAGAVTGARIVMGPKRYF